MSTPDTKPHFRFWMGQRLANLPPQSFAQGLLGSFMPATPALLFPLGLQWYAPVILPFEKPLGMADELALLVYEVASAYEAIQTTLTGQIYSAAHASLFDFSNKASTTLTHDGWGLASLNDQYVVLGTGDWPGASDAGAVSTMGPEHVAMAALQFGPTPHLPHLQTAVQQALDTALKTANQISTADGQAAAPPVRLYLVWQPNPTRHPQAGPNLYLWCLSALGQNWASDMLRQVLQQALPAAYAPNPLSTPIWLWQAPTFASAQAPSDGHTKDQGLTGTAWGKGWVYARPQAETLSTPPSHPSPTAGHHSS